MAPVAGMLAAGRPVSEISHRIADPVFLDVAPALRSGAGARIIHIDVFGNATTNVDHETLTNLADRRVVVKGRDIGDVRRTYWDVAPGEPLALIGSSGLLEIAVRDGSAAEQLNLKVGDEVSLA
jgi:S-adenosylmethionine hydrolase